MKLPSFEYACPRTLSEAIGLLSSSDGDAKVLAGGQSLMPMMAFRVAQPSLLVDLRKLDELRHVQVDDQGVRLGAMVTWRQILDDKRLNLAAPLLQAAISNVAHYQIRNRGTIGGSAAHADPAAEFPSVAQLSSRRATSLLAR
jgi:carbon-monoxide dehydrogenase medium subunit